MCKIDYIEKFLKIDLEKSKYQLEIFTTNIKSDLITFKRDLTLNIIDPEYVVTDKYCVGYTFDELVPGIYFCFHIFPYPNSSEYEEVIFTYTMRTETFGNFSRKSLITQDY